jgi:hypothetical protein
MTQFTRVNGDFQPVAVYDYGTGNAYFNDNGNTNAITSNVAVQPQGPQLQFFTLTGNAAANFTAYSNVIFSTVEQLSTVMIYEENAANTAISFATYPASVWNTENDQTPGSLANLVFAALTAAGSANANCVPTATATFTN